MLVSVSQFIVDYLPWLTWIAIPVVIIILLIITWKQSKIGVLSKTSTKKRDTRQDLSRWIEHIDRAFKIEVNRVELRHLWNNEGTNANADPYLLFELVVWNNTPTSIKINGCEGTPEIDGDTGHFDVVFKSDEPIIITQWAYQTPTLKLRLSAPRGQELLSKIDEGKRITFALSGIKLKIEDGNGVSPKKSITVAVSFVIDTTGIDWEHFIVTKKQLTLSI